MYYNLAEKCQKDIPKYSNVKIDPLCYILLVVYHSPLPPTDILQSIVRKLEFNILTITKYY